MKQFFLYGSLCLALLLAPALADDQKNKAVCVAFSSTLEQAHADQLSNLDSIANVSDLPLIAIMRSLQREVSRINALDTHLKSQSIKAENSIKSVEKRLNELTIAVYYQDFSNFFFLTYYCRQIAKLNEEHNSGESPFSKIQRRIEIASSRLDHLLQVLEVRKKTINISAVDAQVIDISIKDGNKILASYKKYNKELKSAQNRFDNIGKRIALLNRYANGTTENGEENTQAVATKNVPSITSRQPIQGQIRLMLNGDKTTNTHTAALIPSPAPEHKNTNVESNTKSSFHDDLRKEGTLTNRVKMALFDPNNAFRSNNSGLGLRQTCYFLGLTFWNSCINPHDLEFAHDLRNLLIFITLSGIATALIAHFFIQNLPKITGITISARFTKMQRPIIFFVLGCALLIYSGYAKKGYLDQHISSAGMYLLICATLYASIVLGQVSRKLAYSAKMVAPLVTLSGIIILYSIMMLSTFLIDITSPIIFLVCGFWQLFILLRHLNYLSISSRIISMMSILIMFLGAYFCKIGYSYMTLIGTLGWLVIVSNICIITALVKLSKFVSKRILRIKKMLPYQRYIKLWVNSLLALLIIPLLSIEILHYGMIWTTQLFDLEHFLDAALNHRYMLYSFIQEITIGYILLLITMAIVLNYIISIMQATLRLVYENRPEFGQIQTAITLSSLIIWCIYCLFALNLLKANYSSMLVIMGGMSVGIGLGLKDTIENLVSGLSLMLGRMRPGDVVECNGIRGKVSHVGYRTTTIETLDGSIICFQNMQIFNQNYRNLTRNHGYELCRVVIGVTYGTDVAHTRTLILEALSQVKLLSSKHSSYVNLEEFADSSINLAVNVWVPVEQRYIVLSSVREAIYNSFKKNGIEIPFPQQELKIKPLLNGMPEQPHPFNSPN